MSFYKLGDSFEHNKFCILPKELYVNPKYRDLDATARELYSILLDRISLSIENKWANEDGEVYVMFTRDNLMELIGVTDKTLKKAIDALVKVDLVRDVEQAKNKPHLIFVGKVESTDKEIYSENKNLCMFMGIKFANTNPYEAWTRKNSDTEDGVSRKNSVLSTGKFPPSVPENFRPNYTNINYTNNNYTGTDGVEDLSSDSNQKSNASGVGSDCLKDAITQNLSEADMAFLDGLDDLDVGPLPNERHESNDIPAQLEDNSINLIKPGEVYYHTDLWDDMYDENKHYWMDIKEKYTMNDLVSKFEKTFCIKLIDKKRAEGQFKHLLYKNGLDMVLTMISIAEGYMSEQTPPRMPFDLGRYEYMAVDALEDQKARFREYKLDKCFRINGKVVA